ncbi:hypothetical protein BDV12DRAFT_196209 [Aspergillus spectabilis]
MARLPYPNFRAQHTSPKHTTINVLKLLSYSPSTVTHWAHIGNAQFNSLEISNRDRELVILLSTAKFKSNYEWTHHIPVSRKAGVTDLQRAEIEKAGKVRKYFSEGGFDERAGFSEKDAILLRFVEAVIEEGVVGEEHWGRMRGVFSDREVVEVISLQGFYYTFSRLTTVLDVEIDDFARAKL